MGLHTFRRISEQRDERERGFREALAGLGFPSPAVQAAAVVARARAEHVPVRCLDINLVQASEDGEFVYWLVFDASQELGETEQQLVVMRFGIAGPNGCRFHEFAADPQQPLQTPVPVGAVDVDDKQLVRVNADVGIRMPFPPLPDHLRVSGCHLWPFCDCRAFARFSAGQVIAILAPASAIAPGSDAPNGEYREPF